METWLIKPLITTYGPTGTIAAVLLTLLWRCQKSSETLQANFDKERKEWQEHLHELNIRIEVLEAKIKAGK